MVLTTTKYREWLVQIYLIFCCSSPGGQNFSILEEKIVNSSHDSCTSVKGPSVLFGSKIVSYSQISMSSFPSWWEWKSEHWRQQALPPSV